MPEANTDYTVYFENVATSKIIFFNGTSDADGLLTITPSTGFLFAENQDYELWATERDEPIEERVDFEPEGFGAYDDPANCFLVSFVHVWDSEGGVNNLFTSQTFQL